MISLSEKYYLVVNDKFELFYRGVVKSFNPYKYYIKATCIKGYTYQRYFTYTPKEDECGSYELEISIYDDEGNVIESKKTTLVVNKPIKVSKTNILCIGDSLTVNGVWPFVGNEKYSKEYPNILNFMGKMHKGEVGFEGYGGWQWKTFCTDNKKSVTSSVWVTANTALTDYNQHTIWENNELLWVLETIGEGKLKFKRGENNNKVNPELGKTFKCISDITLDDIEVISYDYSDGNPFWNTNTESVDFKYYQQINGFEKPDLIFFLLTWNGQFIPYNTDFSIHDEHMQIIIDNIHESFPDAKIGLMGIQLPCPNGGITACYGANGYYHDWYGETITAFNYDEFLEHFTKREKYKDFVFYSDTKAQFDCEYNYHVKEENVNARNNEHKERLGVNGIHPSMNGYLQIGDAFYRYLVQLLCTFRKQ